MTNDLFPFKYTAWLQRIFFWNTIVNFYDSHLLSLSIIMSGGLGWISSPSVKMGMQSLISHSVKNYVLTYSHAWHFQITSNQF